MLLNDGWGAASKHLPLVRRQYVNQIGGNDLVMWPSCLHAGLAGKVLVFVVVGGGRENLNHWPTLGCQQEVMSGLAQSWPWRSVFHYAAQTAEGTM